MWLALAQFLAAFLPFGGLMQRYLDRARPQARALRIRMSTADEMTDTVIELPHELQVRTVDAEWMRALIGIEDVATVEGEVADYERAARDARAALDAAGSLRARLSSVALSSKEGKVAFLQEMMRQGLVMGSIEGAVARKEHGTDPPEGPELERLSKVVDFVEVEPGSMDMWGFYFDLPRTAYPLGYRQDRVYSYRLWSERFKAVAEALSRFHEGYLGQLLGVAERGIQTLVTEREHIAGELDKRVKMARRLVIDVALLNSGRSPAFMASHGTLEVRLPDAAPIPLPIEIFETTTQPEADLLTKAAPLRAEQQLALRRREAFRILRNPELRVRSVQYVIPGGEIRPVTYRTVETMGEINARLQFDLNDALRASVLSCTLALGRHDKTSEVKSDSFKFSLGAVPTAQR